MEELCRRHDLVLDLSAIRYVAHWVTPVGEGPRRFDTRFFLAAAPDGPGGRPRRRRAGRQHVGPPRRRHRQGRGRRAADDAADDRQPALRRRVRRRPTRRWPSPTPSARRRGSSRSSAATTTGTVVGVALPGDADYDDARLNDGRRRGRPRRRPAGGPSSRPCRAPRDRRRRRERRVEAVGDRPEGALRRRLRRRAPPVVRRRHRRTRPARAAPDRAAARRSRRPAPRRRRPRTAAYDVPCSHVKSVMFSITPTTRTKLRRAMSAARWATFWAASAGVVTITMSARGSSRARPIWTSPVPGGMSISRSSRSPQCTSRRNCSTALVSIRPRHIRAVSSSTRKPVDTTFSRPSPTASVVGDDQRAVAAVDPLGLHALADAEQAGHREAPDVGVEHADRATLAGEGDGEVDGDRALADAALAAGDRRGRGSTPGPGCRRPAGGRSSGP